MIDITVTLDEKLVGVDLVVLTRADWDKVRAAVPESAQDALDGVMIQPFEWDIPSGHTCPECERAEMNEDDHVFVCPRCGYETDDPTDNEDND